MVFLDTSNLTKIEKGHGLSLKEFTSTKKNLIRYLNQIHKHNQGFYKTIEDKNIIKEINAFEKKIRNKYKHIVVLGIGGSALGTICLQQSLKHLFENELKKSPTPRLHVIDNIDPILIKELEDVIDYSKTLFIVATKSGSTVETGVQYFYFREKCKKYKLSIKDHFVIITGEHKSFLRETAEKEGIKIFNIPENISGRFSVLTAVSLLPAKLIGINIEKLISGAKKMQKLFLDRHFEKNLPFKLAAIQYLLGKKGKTINVLMPYSQKLIRFTDWYKQLLAESIGKKFNNKWKKIYTGLTPLNALGATDQHSQLQLFNEGPNDKLIIFIETKNPYPKIIIPNPYPKNKALSFLNKKITFKKLFDIEKSSTEKSLTANNRPNITIKINNINEESLGELFLLFEGATAFLGEFYEINAFDQPGVELSKSLIKKTLIKQ